MDKSKSFQSVINPRYSLRVWGKSHQFQTATNMAGYRSTIGVAERDLPDDVVAELRALADMVR